MYTKLYEMRLKINEIIVFLFLQFTNLTFFKTNNQKSLAVKFYCFVLTLKKIKTNYFKHLSCSQYRIKWQKKTRIRGFAKIYCYLRFYFYR